jgi:hypothetical protein
MRGRGRLAPEFPQFDVRADAGKPARDATAQMALARLRPRHRRRQDVPYLGLEVTPASGRAPPQLRLHGVIEIPDNELCHGSSVDRTISRYPEHELPVTVWHVRLVMDCRGWIANSTVVSASGKGGRAGADTALFVSRSRSAHALD